jgi:hypothetical protein
MSGPRVIGMVRLIRRGHGQQTEAVLVTEVSPGELRETLAGRRIRPVICQTIPIDEAMTIKRTVSYGETESD